MNAFALFEMLLYKRARYIDQSQQIYGEAYDIGSYAKRRPTSWNDDPDEIHKEVIDPEVIRFRPAIR